MGRILRKTKLKDNDQFIAVNDARLRLTLVSMANRYSDKVRELIYRTYQDDKIASIYRAIRNSGIYDHGGTSKVYRKVMEYPNAYVADFVNTVMEELYGKEWYKNNAHMKHELVRPWWVVGKL